MKGIVFDIQPYALYDGPGIRTCVYLKGCPLRCAWCHNPESQSPRPEMLYWRERCARCGRCVEACDHRALTKGTEGPVRDRGRCLACGACARACPNRAMERVGEEMTVEDVTRRVLPDRPFFQNSGGGVTVSGGEPTAQPDFLLELLTRFKAEGLHTAIETAGLFPSRLIPALIKVTDLVLFDLKHADIDRHEAGAGAGNAEIRDNFAAILALVGSDRVIPRLPLIPAFNVDPAAIQKMIAFLSGAGYKGPVHLMPGHRLARGKYQALGRAAEAERVPLTPEALEEIRREFLRADLAPECYG